MISIEVECDTVEECSMIDILLRQGMLNLGTYQRDVIQEGIKSGKINPKYSITYNLRKETNIYDTLSKNEQRRSNSSTY